ncbi:hypothetical protein [Primorskyibacter sp. S187A]|uniref:hypothetical protein n=1 Tax=Primorskyibacter sp. S187A TaxID=3415130 RepID=UPI003C7AB69E
MRFVVLCLALLSLAACTGGRDLDKPPAPLGDFRLGHSVVVAPNLVKGPLSREVSQEEWIAAVDKALEDRFRRYDGERLYHFGVSVEGYVVAQVGVPLVLQPKSVLIYRITVWDDAEGKKMNGEPKEFTATETFSAETVVGSGLTQTREEQLENLAINAAKQVEVWLGRQKRQEKWFRGFRPGGEAGNEAGEGDEMPTSAEATDAADAATSQSDDVQSSSVVEPEEAVSDPEVVAIAAEAEEAAN